MHFNLKPLITEKSMSKVPDGIYTFAVPKNINKKQIEEKVAEIYKVKVYSVKTTNVIGKLKRHKGNIGKRKDWKKAIVILEKGQQIKGFSEILQDKADKKVTGNQ